MQRDHRSIRELAYRLWESRGRPEGSPERDWLDAERQLLAAGTPEDEAGAPPQGDAAQLQSDAAKREGDAAKREASKTVDEALKDSFPASDAPGSHLPDVPPANADAKWEAAGVERNTQSQISATHAPQAAGTPRKDSGNPPDR